MDQDERFDDLLRKLIRMVEREDPKPLTRLERKMLNEIEEELVELWEEKGKA